MFLLALVLLLILGVILFAYRARVSKLTLFTVIIYVISFFIFGFLLLIYCNEHYVAIDPIDNGYTPFGHEHILTLIVFYVLYNISNYLLWIKSEKLPPLTWATSCCIVVIGIVLNCFIIVQTAYVDNNMRNYNYYPSIDGTGNTSITLFGFYPLLAIIISIYLLSKSYIKVADRFNEYQYKNKTLDYLHQILLKRNAYPLFITVLIFPVFLTITLLLMLFGQEYDSMVKVFTDTATWRFSQQIPPPALDHTGHYLCTVAAKGDPNVVKPLRLGTRHGKPIVVNRQLMIANAFEEMIQLKSKKAHHIIRTNYDRYGYNLSQIINTPLRSNIVYILMKPLEWFFLISLYLGVQKPEVLIKKQYQQ